MSEALDEEVLSPDIFSDVETMKTTNNTTISDGSSSTSIGITEPEPSDDIPEWKGISMEEIRKGLGVYDCQELPPVSISSNHTILISLPLLARGPPKPYPTQHVDKWSQGYVRMPHSTHSLYPIDQKSNNGNASKQCQNRWEIIQESLLQNFVSTQQLEAAILSYNHIYAQRWDFTALHNFFSTVVDEEETNIFFNTLMPKMIQLALQLPVLVTGAVPLLKRHTNVSITLSQLQVASLLANAFFCTFPRRNSTNPQSEYATYPFINFNRLFSAYKDDRRNRCESVMEKLKCLFHYFRRVTSKVWFFHRAVPEGVITIQRRYIPKQDCPNWERQNQKLPPLHITSKGTIETDGAGLLQVDFANKYLGGGVLGLGCVQEEIRFAICPELMVTMLVTEAFDDTEALVVSGIERYSKYEGYANNFKWMGDFVDETPRDSSGRRLTSIVAIDALFFKQPASQFSISNITRELNKAYVGFIGAQSCRDNLPAIATGNWGCGAFHGNPKLKVLLQLMAAAVAERSVVYFTFGDTNLRDSIAEMYSHFVEHNIDIAHLYSLLVQYQEFSVKGSSDFYRFLYNRSRIKPLTNYFSLKSKVEILPKNTEVVSQKNKIIRTNDKRYFQSNFKEQLMEEDKIQIWLTACEEDFENINTVKTPENRYKEHKIDIEYEEKELKDDRDPGKNNVDKKKKPTFWKFIEDKAESKTICEPRLTGLDLLDVKQELLPSQSNDVNMQTEVIRKISTTADELKDKCENSHVKSESLIESSKYNSPFKKTGQRKISDFFQRTS